MSAPDHLEARCRLLPLVRGPVTIQVVRDPMRGSGLRGGPGSLGGPEPRLLALECLPLPGHAASPDLPQPWIGSGPLSGEQDFGPQGSGCLDVVKDNYKGPCLDTARGGTPVLGYRHPQFSCSCEFSISLITNIRTSVQTLVVQDIVMVCKMELSLDISMKTWYTK